MKTYCHWRDPRYELGRYAPPGITNAGRSGCTRLARAETTMARYFVNQHDTVLISGRQKRAVYKDLLILSGPLATAPGREDSSC